MDEVVNTTLNLPSPKRNDGPIRMAAVFDLVAVCELVCVNLPPDHPLRAAATIALQKAGREAP